MASASSWKKRNGSTTVRAGRSQDAALQRFSCAVPQVGHNSNHAVVPGSPLNLSRAAQ